MTSINTNGSAMFALQTLRMVNKELDATNNRISTGLKINSAADGAAYWSISSTLKSDNGSLGAVKDAIALDKNSVDAAANGLDNILKNLDNIKAKLTAATSANIDRKKLQTEINSFVDQIKTTAGNTVMNGDNWLSTDTSATNFNEVKGLVSSFSRNGTAVKVDTTDLDTGAFIIYDASTSNSAKTKTTEALAKVAAAASLDSIDVAVSTATGEVKGFMDTKYVIDLDGTGTGTAALTAIAIEDFDISAFTDSDAHVDTIKAYIAIVDATIQQLQNGATDLGSTSTRMASNSEFVQKLMDINKSSIGALVDADLEEESTRLKALQTQQQLGIQSLSIVNSASGNVLSLFRS